MRGKKFLSALIAAAMLGSTAGISALAESVADKPVPYSTYNYVALGDSIAAGFGLAGGDLAADPALVITDKLLADPVQGAYPAIFTGYLKELGAEKGVEVKGTNLASTAYRAEDIEKTIRTAGYKGEFASSILEAYAGEGSSDVLTPYHDLYNKYLDEADMVSIQLGGNDIVMSIIPEMTSSENPVLRATGMSLMLTLFGTDQKTALGGGLQVLEQSKDEVTAESFLEAAAYMKNVSARSEELVAESASHVKGVVDAVKEVNDDADIALVGMFNPYRQEEVSEETQQDMSEVIGQLFAAAADRAAETEDELTTDGQQTQDYIKKITDEVNKVREIKAVMDKYNDKAEMQELIALVQQYNDMEEVKELAELYANSEGSPAEADLMAVMTKYNDIEELQSVLDIVKNNGDAGELAELAAVMNKYRTAEESAAAQAMAAQIAGPMVMQMAGKNVDPQMKLLNEKLKAVAEETGATYVDVYGISPETDSDPHPNANGHREIADILFNTMKDIASSKMGELDEIVTDEETIATNNDTVTTDSESKKDNDNKDAKKSDDEKSDEKENKPLLGDVNGDGKINAADITKIAAHIKGIKLLSEDRLKYADVDGNGRVNVTDIVLIAAHIKGLKTLN